MPTPPQEYPETGSPVSVNSPLHGVPKPMSSPVQIIKEPSRHLARPLPVLEPLILKDIETGEKAGVPHYASAGEKLWEAKTHFKSITAFYEWAAKKFKRSQRTIRNWMIYAQNEHGGQPFHFEQDMPMHRASSSQPKRYKTLSEVAYPGLPPHHRPSWYPDVQKATERLNVSRMAQEMRDKATEKELRRKLSLQLIDIGYKVLAAKLHPDKGGSREAMQRLNEVRKILKGAI
jgi:hypothetical protein